MDFFEHQHVARRKTGRLVVLFVAAVIAIILLTDLVVAGALVGARMYGGREREVQWSGLADPVLLLAVGAGAIVLVAGGSMAKLWQLRGGGRVVAESVGGRRLDPGTGDFVQRRLLNVVEEMAIAAGTPVPPVYMLEGEAGVNAFAAGFAPSDAVVAVTRGAAERLSRDELQGVIGHEFSHILNGDMRLNIRLMGVLHGILIIGILGQFLLRSAFYTGAAYRRSSRDRGGGGGALLAMGAGLMVVGFAGTFFGNWIKAAVSRQREFLADASAVQFTRNPAGIAGALKKIGGFARRARIDNPSAGQVSHMFFGRALTSGLNTIFSTHPPLAERIRRLEPSWDGEFLASEPAGGEAMPAAAAGLAGAAAGGGEPGPPAPAGPLVGRIGNPAPAHLDHARDLLGRIPAELAAAAREPFGARAVILGLLLDAEHRGEVRRRQFQCLQEGSDAGVRDELRRLLPALDGLDAALRLPLIETAIPALTAMSPAQHERFAANVTALIGADDRIDLFEWCLQRIVLGHLAGHFGRAPRPRTQFYGLGRLGPECGQLLSVLAHVGQRDPEAARRAFAAAARELGGLDLALLPPGRCGLDQLDRALERLAVVAPRPKRQVVRACAACIAADREVTVREAEVLRAVVEALGCPMPPLLPGQRLL